MASAFHARLEKVPARFLSRTASRYSSLDPGVMQKLKRSARSIKGVSIIHISATAKGGGVAELLKSQVSFERACGIDSRWYTISAPKSFFEVTKKMHNLLHGQVGVLQKNEKMAWREVQHELGDSFKEIILRIPRGIVMIHDFQPLGLVQFVPPHMVPVVRLHIDLSTPNEQAFKYIVPFLGQYRQIIVHEDHFDRVFPKKLRKKILIIRNSIDPATPKNIPMTEKNARRALARLGVDSKRPLLAQVSRFDPWKDPLGVIDMYRAVKRAFPGIQLVLAGLRIAADDPEADRMYRLAKIHAGRDRDIKLFFHPKDIGRMGVDAFVNAVYSSADVMIQNSVREGFGLTMTEAMWKGKPLVARKTAGAKVQIEHDKSGYIYERRGQAIRIIETLLSHPSLRRKIGKAARESVRHKFLFGRYVGDHIRAYRELLAQ